MESNIKNTFQLLRLCYCIVSCFLIYWACSSLLANDVTIDTCSVKLVNADDQGIVLRNLALEAAEDWRLQERLAHLERTTAKAERFSALGDFTVGRPTLLGVMSTVATYLIILMQST